MIIRSNFVFVAGNKVFCLVEQVRLVCIEMLGLSLLEYLLSLVTGGDYFKNSACTIIYYTVVKVLSFYPRCK